MFPDNTLTWSGPRDRWARVILIVAAVGVLIAAWTAVSTLRARAQVHEAAKASLSNYAAVAIEQFVNGYEALLRDNFIPIRPAPARRPRRAHEAAAAGRLPLPHRPRPQHGIPAGHRLER